MLNASNLSFALCPLLTDGAIEALLTAGTEAQAQRYVGSSYFSCLYGPDASCKLLVRDVKTVCSWSTTVRCLSTRATAGFDVFIVLLVVHVVPNIIADRFTTTEPALLFVEL
jgi:hypothetical protein